MYFSSSSTGVPPRTARRSPLSDLKAVKSGPTGSRKQEQKRQPQGFLLRVGADAKGWLGTGLRYNTVRQSFLPSGAGGASWQLTIRASHHPHVTAQPLCRQAGKQAGRARPSSGCISTPCDIPDFREQCAKTQSHVSERMTIFSIGKKESSP